MLDDSGESRAKKIRDSARPTVGNFISKLESPSREPMSYARSFWEGGGKVVGYFCSYFPAEMIHAHGVLPVRIMGADREPCSSSAHLQSYCCSLARTSLDLALDGNLDFLEGTAFVHTCDTMQRLSDIWRLNTGGKFHADLVLPVRFDGEAHRQIDDAALAGVGASPSEGTPVKDYLLRELAELWKKFDEFFGESTLQKLEESIETYEKTRLLKRRLYSLRKSNPTLISSADSIRMTTSAFLTDREEYNVLLGQLLSALETKVTSPTSSTERFPVFLSGSIMDQWDFLELLDDLGAVMVDDDFCNGGRDLYGGAPSGGDALERIADRILSMMPCPCKHAPSPNRGEIFMERVKDSGAKGVLFFHFRYCDPHAFDYPWLKSMLDSEGIPSMRLEIEHGAVSLQQLRTRVEAFLETLSGL